MEEAILTAGLNLKHGKPQVNIPFKTIPGCGLDSGVKRESPPGSGLGETRLVRRPANLNDTSYFPATTGGASERDYKRLSISEYKCIVHLRSDDS